MKKKLLVLALTLTMSVWALAGCGGGDAASEPADDSAKAADTYSNSEVSTELPIADEVSAFYDAIDMDYTYDLSYELAYSEKHPENVDHLGWRTAGSDGEHACADFLAKEMEKIGLENVEKLPSQCDKFQLNDSSLKIAGTDIDLEPASYQVNGTDGDLTAEIVNCKTGFEWDYDGKDVEGKIVLAKVDQWNEAWIDSYARQAAENGAAALVTWANSGYGEANKDTINVQDVCCEDLGIPIAAISANQAKEIKQAIKDGKNECTLNIDSEMIDNGGITYNVCGMIPGKNHEQRIAIAGHYDKYWYGFQDDCAAIGLVYGIAKAMIDSGYEPENDIYFVCTGAEEWGSTNSQFDWATGAWGLAKDNAEFADKTIAMINCELPAYENEDGLAIQAVTEFYTLVDKLFQDKFIVTAGDQFLATSAHPTTTMDDNISMRCHGVPCLRNKMVNSTFACSNYHTTADDKDTYSADVLQTNMNWYGAYTIYMDTMPALELDFTQTAKELKANFGEEYAAEAGVDTEAYLGKVKELKAKGKELNAQIDEINNAYLDAVTAKDKEAMTKAREDGLAINQKSLAIFQAVQDNFMTDNDGESYLGHPTLNDTIGLVKGAIAGCDDKVLWADDGESGVLDNAWQMNYGHDYNYVLFSEDVARTIDYMYSPDNVSASKDQWGYGHQVPVVEAGSITYKLARQSDEDVDWKEAKAAYQEALESGLASVKAVCDKELNSFDSVLSLF